MKLNVKRRRCLLFHFNLYISTHLTIMAKLNLHLEHVVKTLLLGLSHGYKPVLDGTTMPLRLSIPLKLPINIMDSLVDVFTNTQLNKRT